MRLLAMIISVALTLFWCGCQTTPLESLRDPRPDGTTGIWTGQWLIYGDKLETGGGLLLFPGAENQTIDLAFRHPNKPERGNVIRYSWNGQEVTGQYAFSGVSFTVASNWRTYDITPSKDLSQGGYRKVTFKAKADLSENTSVRFEGPVTSIGVERRRSFDWDSLATSFEPHMLRTVREFFVISFHYNGNDKSGQGGTVYVDDIRLER